MQQVLPVVFAPVCFAVCLVVCFVVFDLVFVISVAVCLGLVFVGVVSVLVCFGFVDVVGFCFDYTCFDLAYSGLVYFAEACFLVVGFD